MRNIVKKEPKLRQQLKQIFLQNIQTGHWRIGEKIPTEDNLAKEYHASRSTIRRAMKYLEEQGFIHAVQGMGRRVASGPEGAIRTIGLLFPSGDLYVGIGADYLRTLHRAVKEAGYHLAIMAGGSPRLSPLDIQKLSGLMLIAQHLPATDIDALARQIPLVILGHEASSIHVPSFFVDYGAQTALAVRFLLDRGHSRIAITFGSKPYFYQTGINMRNGLEWTMKLAGKCCPPEQIMVAALNNEGGRDLYRRIRRMEPKITALIAYGPTMIRGMEEEAAAAGGKLPDELEIICLNHLDEIGSPAWLHHFQCPYDQAAEAAFHELLRLMKADEPVGEIHHPFCGKLIEARK